VFRPGKANQVAIQDGYWVGEETLAVRMVAMVRAYLKKLLGESEPASVG
jgi:hypothetical protein